MYNRLLEELKKKFAGVSDQILARIAKKLEPGVKSEDDVKTAVEGVTFQQMLEIHGDFRATEAAKTAVSNYERKHSIKDGKPVKNPEQSDEEEGQVSEDGPKGEKIPAWAKTLISGYKAMEEKVSKMAGERVTASRKQQLDKVLSALPESMRKGYDRITLDTMEDDAFKELINDVETEVQQIQKEQKVKGAVFGRPTVNSGAAGSGSERETGSASKEEIDEAMKQIKIL